MKALIAGGGIGGLTTALFLNGVGIEAEVFEAIGEPDRWNRHWVHAMPMRHGRL